MSILRLIAELGLSGKGFKAGLHDAQKHADRFADNMQKQVGGAIAGAFSVYAVGAFVRATIDASNRVKDLSEQFGITTDQVQALDRSAVDVGLSFETFGTALTKLGQARREAAEGNEETRKTFETFGVSLDDLQNPALGAYDILKKIGETLRGMNVSPRQRTDLQDLFGRGGGRLLEAVREFQERRSSMDIPEEAVRSIDAWTKAIGRAGKASKAAFASAFGGLGFMADAALKRLGFGGVISDKPASGPAEGPDAGPLFDDKEAKKRRVKQLEEEMRAGKELADILEKLELAKLKPAERRKRIEQDIIALREAAQRASAAGDNAKAFDLQTKAAEMELNLLEVKKKAPKEIKSASDVSTSGFLTPQAAARLGSLSRGANNANPTLPLLSRQIALQEKQLAALREIIVKRVPTLYASE